VRAEKGDIMARTSSLLLLVGLPALLPALGLTSGCPAVDEEAVPKNVPNINDAELTLVRIELDATGLVGIADGFRADLSSLDVHKKGGWQTYELAEQGYVAAGDTLTLLRVVDPDESVKMLRAQGEFSLVIAGEHVPVTVTSARGVQVHIDQPLVPGAVNHVRIDLAAALQSKKNGWRLHPSLKAEVSADPSALASGVVTPGAGGAIELDDGFRLEVPPGAVTDDTLIWVERVPTSLRPYYLLGPEHLRFNLPVTAHVPGETPEPVVSWDFKRIAGELDPQGRVAAQNDHFSCLFIGDLSETATPLGATAILFENKPDVEDMCDVNYSIVITDLHDARTRVVGGIGPAANETGKLGCEGEDIYEAPSLDAIFGDKPGFTKVAATPGDLYQCNGAPKGERCHNAHAPGCVRQKLSVGGAHIHDTHDPSTWQHYIGFHDATTPPTQVTVTAREDFVNPENVPNIDPFADTLVHSGYRYMLKGEKNFTNPPEPFVLKAEWRSSIGFSKDRRYMFQATGGSNFTGDQWVNLLANSREFKKVLVSADTAYRMDEGGTTGLHYSTDGKTWDLGLGSQSPPDGTIMGLAVYERLCDDPGFLDVPVKEWFYEPVKQIVCQGAVPRGNKGNKFAFLPSAKATRGWLLKLQLKLAFPATAFEEHEVLQKPFDDVEVDDEYAPYIQFAKKEGIVEGYPDNTYKPYSPISRAETAQLTVRVGKHKDAAGRYRTLYFLWGLILPKKIEEEQEFDDVAWAKLPCPDKDAHNSATCWFYHAVYALNHFDGAICGDAGTNQFRPHDDVNRAEGAKLSCIVSGYCEPQQCM
jgi:hypothetical protein